MASARAGKQTGALILEIQRMSTEDGPGIRTTVFFKGCPLRCRWCHNPESISPEPQIQWVGVRCIGCGTCVTVCPQKALVLDGQGLRIDRTACLSCGACVEACPSTALQEIGRIWPMEDLLGELRKDRAYFEASSGGITLSGGEPGMQASFAAALLARLHKEGFHTALDTCGYYPGRVLEGLLPHSALVLFDLKEIDALRHRKFTGHDNRLILHNAVLVADSMRRHGYPKALWVRTPVIPGATDRPQSMAAIGAFIAEHLAPQVGRWELCAFNNLCKDKYRRLDRAWEFDQAELMSRARMQELVEAARGSGIDPAIVHAAGMMRGDEPEPG